MRRVRLLGKVTAAAAIVYAGYSVVETVADNYRGGKEFSFNDLISSWGTSNVGQKGFAGAREKFVKLPTRAEQIDQLKEDREFDVLVIGGGATGSGIALDAVTRGLKVALIEREDFASGTSSKSTKLIHGGVRYLEKAVKEFDFQSFMLVFDALHERANFFRIAPYLSNPLPIMTPCYLWWEAPYYWIGMKMYDLLAGGQKLHWSRYLNVKNSLAEFPMLDKAGLKGTIVYYDGQMNDARLNVCVALTAAKNGAVVANYTEVVNLIKNGEKVAGARVRDVFTGEEWDVRAKVVINATGAFSDGVRKMDNPNDADIISPSSGVHVVLPDYYSPKNTGLIIPKTKDGRVLFLLPWLGSTIAGTTDAPTKITRYPHPTEEEIVFILEALSDYLNVNVRREDVRAAWSGIRPLAQAKGNESTAHQSRDHLVLTSDSNLITIAGGKWTTYRKMAEDAVDKAVEVGKLKTTRRCQTRRVQLIGAENWEPAFFTLIAQNFKRMKKMKYSDDTALVGISTDIAQNLSNSYGTRALHVAEIAERSHGSRLHDSHPYIEAEVVYAVEEEMACTAVDVLARRLRIAFLDVEASHECAPRVVDIMARVLNWDEERKRSELAEVERFLHYMTVGRKGSKGNVKPAKDDRDNPVDPEAVHSSNSSEGSQAESTS